MSILEGFSMHYSRAEEISEIGTETKKTKGGQPV